MPTGPSKDKRVIFLRVPEELWQALRREAFERDISMNALVIEKLKKALKF